MSRAHRTGFGPSLTLAPFPVCNTGFPSHLAELLTDSGDNSLEPTPTSIEADMNS
jgi:hypothetical protein